MNITFIFLLSLALVLQITPCSGTAKLMIRFDSFQNAGFLKEDGKCCDGESRNGNCTGQCDYGVNICLSRNATGDPCEIETFDVGSVDVDTSSFNFPLTFISGFANPLPITLDLWQGDIIVTVNIYDADTQKEEKVDSFNFTYTKQEPISSRSVVRGDFQEYTLTGKRTILPTGLDIAVAIQCDRFFYGDDCSINCVENDDCNGHYTCNSITGAKICNEGWDGDNCSISVSEDHGCFSSQQCSNNAECIRYGNTPSDFYCCCAPGFTGDNCEIDVDECSSNPCENGGSCTQAEPNSFACSCPVRFKGPNCELQRTCDDNPCMNGGDCRSVFGSFFCICNTRFTGEVCETPITTTTESTTTATTTPACPANLYGSSCSVYCEPRNDCGGHYSCDSQDGNRICSPTWGGVNCTQRTFIDATCPCQNGGQCFESQCCCPEEFTGSLCEFRIRCNADRCLNGGQCYEEANGFRCECARGFTGENCETELTTSNPAAACPKDYYGPTCSAFCRSQEDCFAGQWNCHPMTGERLCRFGWMGEFCNQRDPRARHDVICPNSQCRNGGVCTNATCCCPIGYTGSLCHIEILECASNPCRNSGRCEDLIGDYLCTCSQGYTGRNCEYYVGGSTITQEPDLCLSVNCQNGGTCVSNSSTETICLCPEGFRGDLCAETTSRPSSTPGQNSCPENYYGQNCLTYCKEEDTCEGGHYYCDPSSGRKLCRNGWIGTICNSRVLLQEIDPECPAVGCKNQGQCFNGSCCCHATARGEYCQEEILACSRNPCQNSGTCKDLTGGYNCSCSPGYSGINCETFIGFPPGYSSTTSSSVSTGATNRPNTLEACDEVKCLNGGFCVQVVLPFSCVCIYPFTGEYCEIDMSITTTTDSGLVTGQTPTSVIQTIYLRGNVSDSSQAALEQILQAALNRSINSSSCCVLVYILQKTTYMGPRGDIIVGYVYNFTHTTGSAASGMTPEQINNFSNEVDIELQRTNPFSQNGVLVYRGPSPSLVNLRYTYTTDFVGDIPDSRRQAVIADIEAAWRNANPDCRCQFSADIVQTETYIGDYGIKISRVYYTITRDGRFQDPVTVQPPSRQVFFNTVQGAGSVNSIYTGSLLVPYNQRHSVLVNSVVDMGGPQGTAITNDIRSAWIRWRDTDPSVPPNLRNAPLEVMPLRAQKYYTQDGIQMTKVEYFVRLGNTNIVGPESANVSISGPIYCTDENCGIPVPFVDVKGHLTSVQLQMLGNRLNPSDTTGITISSDRFINSDGEPVTRVYYRPPISGPGVQSTAIGQARLTQILTDLNLQQPSLPLDRSFSLYFAGRIGDNNRTAIEQTILNAWAGTLGIPPSVLSVNINSMNDNYVSTTSDGRRVRVTQVMYTVSIQGADSQWTRFEGVEPGMLGRYITSPGLVLVQGEVTSVQGETTGSSTTETTTSPGTTSTGSTYLIQTIYLKGNISDGSQNAVEEILLNAFNSSMNGSSCCLRLYIIEQTNYIDPNGNLITGYRYNISNSTGSPLDTMTPEQTTVFTNLVNNELQRTEPFLETGAIIYTGSVQVLRPIEFAYTVDFVGDIPDSWRQAVIDVIETAWTDTYPGQYQANIVRMQEFTGDYGITVTRVYYTTTSDGQIQDPKIVTSPTNDAFTNVVQQDTDVNELYSGSSLLPYNRHHSVFLTRVVDMDSNQGVVVRNAIESAWINWRNTNSQVPQNLRNAPLRIVLLRPETYYTQDGRQLTKIRYLVLLNNTIVIGPQTANVPLSNVIFCDCEALPVPFVDVKGQLTVSQLQTLASALNPSDVDGRTTNTEVYWTSSGEPITRVYYRPPISGPSVQSTAVSQQRLDQILTNLNLEQHTSPMTRVFTIYFGGRIGNSSREAVQQGITSAWAAALGIPMSAISTNIITMDDNYFSSTSNTPVTQVTYSVSIQGADSHWTRFVGVNAGTLGQYLNSTDLTIVGGAIIRTQGGTVSPGQTTQTTTVQGGITVRPTVDTTTQTIYLTGIITEGSQPSVEEILQNALNNSNTGSSCCLRLYVIEKTSYLDPSGNIVTGYIYNVTNSTSGMPVTMTPEQTSNFTNEVNNEFQKSDPFREMPGGVAIYTGSVQGLKSVGLAYTVDFIGDLPESRRPAVLSAIEEAWHQLNPGCGCQFKANLLQTQEFTGDYSTTVSRVFYTMARDGVIQDPDSVQPPSEAVLLNTLQRDTNVNSVYVGETLIPSNRRHSLLLNRVVDIDGNDRRLIEDIITTGWLNWINLVLGNLGSAPFEVVLLRPRMYYTQDGTQLSMVQYYVVVNNTIVIGPQTANLTLTGSLVCDCDALPVPFVDVKGQLTLTQLQTFGSYLNPFDRTGSTINTETFRNTVGEEVTRVYYRPPISSPEVTTTAISPERLTEVLEFLKLEQPSRPIRRTFNMYFGGSIDDSKISSIEETITNAWATTLGIPTDAVSVRVDTMDDNYFSRTSNTQVTRVTYSVSIQGADSHWTRFVGLNAGTLIPYFNSPDLYIVGGAIIRTQGGTLPTSTISTVSGVTTVTASTTAGATTTRTIYLTGNISEGTQPAVEDVLQNALNKSSNEGSCCLRLYIIERTSYIDPSGVVLTGYRYNVTNSTSGMPVSLTPEQTTNFTREVNNEILKSDPLLAGGVYVYTDFIQGLKTTELAYSVDLIGRIPESRQNTVLDAIEQAWQEAYPNCRCVFKANMVQIEELSGDYGITVSRVYYTVTRDGQPEDPSKVTAPSRQDVVNAVQQDAAVNQVYPGSQLIPYNQRHGLLLNKVVDMDSPEGTYIRNAIQTAWIDWRNADPSVPASLRNAELDILMLKPLKYYTQDGRQLTKIEYFVLLNNTVVIGPKRANITLTDPLFCDCEAVPVPFVDVDGELTPLQMQILGLNLNPLDTSGVTIERENFVDTNGGPVTRVYYRPPITGPGVQSTDVSQQRLNQILTNLNLQQPSDPIDKSFILYIGGRLTDDDRDNIETTIRSAWSSTYNLPAGAISVKVINLDDSFVSTPGNTPVTQVKYTVTVEGADSHWTRFDGVDSGTLGRYFTPTGFTVFQGEVKNTQVTTTPQGMTQFTGETATPTSPTGTTNFVSVIYLRGNISDSNQAAVEGILQNALNKTKNGPSCCIELHIIEKTTYLDASGDVITGYRFNASNGTAAVVLTPDETSNFTNEVSNGLQTSDVLRGQGIVIYQGSVQGQTDTYSVDFVGDVPETRKQAVLTDIEKAWINTFPECGCVFRANIVKMDEFSGDFGIKVTRINYRVTKDGLIQDPKTVTPPTRQVFYNTVQGDASVNSIYSGATLIPYSQHHNVFLSKVVDMSSDEGRQVLDQIRSTWITWRNTSPAVTENLKLAPVEIKLLRPLIYYTQDGRQLTKLEYFVILNGTNVIGPQQQTDSVTFTGPLFCDCEAIPVPFVEVKGRLSSAQLQTLGFNLNPSDGSAVSSEMFFNSKNEPVTRVYYRPPISNPDVTSTAINQQRLNQILTNQNLEQPSLPTEKLFTFNIAGRTGNNNRNAIIQILKNLWVTTFNVPSDSVSIDIKTIDENYVSSTSNAPVTQVTYTVAIQGADSHLTQFEGVDPGTLGQYFRSLGIILVEGDVVRVQGRTTPSSGTGQTANPTTPTGATNFVNVIVLRGNVSDSYRAAVEELLQNALNKTKNGPSCCIQLYVIEQSTVFDPNGDVLTSYRFNATNSSAPVMLTPEEIANFTYEVSNGLQTSDVLRGQGIVIYQGPVQGPTDTYSVDFVGDVPETRKQAVLTDIEKAWMNAYPDCRCEFNADVVQTDEFAGDFGIKITRVYYTITKDGLVQDPKTVTPPTRQVFYNTVQGDASVNSIYSGATLIPYSQHHNVFLSKVVDMSSDEGQQVLDQIRSTWITWRNTSPAVPENLKLAPVEIKLLRPLIYYTQDGRQLTKLEYFVILNGTNVIGPQQQTDSVTFTGPLFCDCEAIPVPFVEVKGRLSSAQLQTLGFNLNPSDGSAVSSEMFFNSKNEPVTRVYYRPPISNPDVTSTAINQQRLNQILTNQNLEQPSLPTEKLFTFNIAGRTGNNNRNAIIQILKNLWVTTFNVPSDSVSIDIKTIDENYVSSTSNAPVTQVTYTVAIQGADSHLTQFEGVDPGTLGQYFRSLGIILVEGDVVRVQGRTTPSSGTGQTANPTTPTGTTNFVNVIVLRGNVSDSYRAAVEELLQNALNKTKNGPSCCIQLYVIEQSTVFDPNGDVLTSYRFNATNSSAPVMLTPEEIANFTYEVSNGLQTSDVLRGQGIVIYQGPVQGQTDTYSVDFVGDVPETRKQAVLTDIEKAWMNAYPDCRCEFNADVVQTDEFAGDFGIKITRVYYTITKDGLVQDPKTVTPPTRQVFYNTVQGDASVNSIYSGATLIPYSQHHNVFLSKVVDMSSDEGQQVLDQIRSTWITWRSNSPAVPENLRQAPIEIRLLRPLIYYTQDGRQLTKLEYFVILNGTTVIGPQPQTDSVTFTGPLFCDCNAIPVPFIEVKGRLSPDELKTLGSTLNPSAGSVTMSEMFISSNNEPVTRVYYRPPISGPDVTSTAVSQQTLNQILTNWNLEQPTMPTEKSFALNFAGRIGDNDRSAIQQTIQNLWGTTFNISANRLSVDIKSMDDSYVSSTSNTPVTRFIYTVTIQGADSRWTQFEGVDPGTLGQYFRSNGFTLVEGNVERTTQTTPGTGSTATTPSPTDTTNLDSVIYLTGDISDQGAMEEILKNALNKTKNGPACCIELHITDKTNYLDTAGNIITAYRYNATNGSTPIVLTRSEKDNFTREVNNELQTSGLFRGQGIQVYQGSIQAPTSTYTVDFIGEMTQAERGAVITDIEKAWFSSNPDCRCLFKASILTTEKLSGDFGTLVTRVFYTITKDGLVQDPKTVTPPTRQVFYNTVQGDASVNSIYSGATLIPYSQHHNVFLSKVVDMSSDEGQQVLDQIRFTWITWRNADQAVPENLRNAPVEIRPLRPLLYYTQDGKRLTNLEYFVILNGTNVIGPQPQTERVTVKGPLICDCKAIPVPFIEVNGLLSSDQLKTLGSSLNPSDGSDTISELFITSNNEPVTRVYYLPQISGPDVMSTAVSPQRVNQILTNQNLEEPTLPTEKTFTLNFEGSVGNDKRSQIQQTIKNLWIGTFNIPSDALSVNIESLDDGYVSSSNAPVTRMTYTVSIRGADSRWTRFEGVDPARYFTTPDLVVFGGEITRRGSGTSTSTTMTTPGPMYRVGGIYLKGNINDLDQPAVEASLQRAMDRINSGSSCCVKIDILKRTNYINPAEETVVGYRYNMTNSTGGTVNELTPEQSRILTNELNRELQNVPQFRWNGVAVYTGSSGGLRNLGITYSMSITGTVPDRQNIVDAIEQSWRNTYSDCGCQFKADIFLTKQLSGDYGMVVTRVYYTITRDGQAQNAETVPSPPREVLSAAVDNDKTLNPLYYGSTLLPYDQHHSVVLNRVVDMTSEQGQEVTRTLQTEWKRWQNTNSAVPDNLRAVPLEILLLRPQKYYTQAGTSVTNVEYFVKLGDRYLIGPDTSINLSGGIFCDCDAIPVPFVDVKGQLQWSKLLELGTSLNPADTTGSTVDRQMFLDGNGEPVTRVFYRPAIEDGNVQSTALNPERLDEILTNHNLERPSLPIKKTFTFNFDGSLGDDKKNTVADGLLNAWSSSLGIPKENVSVVVSDMNDNFYSTTSDDQVTQVTYTVAILGGDSHWTRFEGVDAGTLGQKFSTTPEVTPCGCLAREGREIMVTGVVGNDTTGLETALTKAWMQANPDYTGTLTVGIKKVEGDAPTKLRYIVTPAGGPSAFTENDLATPQDDLIGNEISPLDLTVYKGKNDDESNTSDWAIPLGIVLGLLLLLIIIIVIVLVIRNRRHRMSHTLKQKPEELNGYDKQHFSDEPHFNNPTFNMEDPEISDGKQRTYIVNEEQTMEDIKLDRST